MFSCRAGELKILARFPVATKFSASSFSGDRLGFSGVKLRCIGLAECMICLSTPIQIDRTWTSAGQSLGRFKRLQSQLQRFLSMTSRAKTSAWMRSHFAR